MIELINVKKTFYQKDVINNLNLRIPNATIFGLLGAGGSGKSTILRLIAGIYHADGGYTKIDGQPVYENVVVKQQIRLVSQEPYFAIQSNLADMRKFYQIHYPEFSDRIYRSMLELFSLNEKKRIHRLPESKKRQAALVLALACNCKYLLLDETFEGMDLRLKESLKDILKHNLEEKGQTVIISSPSFTQLQDICDSLALVKDGSITLCGSQAELSSAIHKFQLSFEGEKNEKDFANLDILHFEKQGHVIQIVVRGDRNKITRQLKAKGPLFIDDLPVSLRESFLSEMAEQGYDQI